jgi:predicted TPR repeat methyltransferase
MTACYNLAFALNEKGEFEKSLQLYNKVITMIPNHVRALCDIAYVLNKLKQPEKALSYITQAIELEPDNEHTLLKLAMIHKKLNNIKQAKICYNKVISNNPDNEIARYYLAMMNGANSFVSSPASYVQELFDGYAETFDNELVSKLKYRIPEQIGEIVKKHSTPSQKYRTLDLGCGTGLVGTHLKDISEHMTGVDIAPKMIKKTAERGVYDELVTSGIDAYFESHEYRPNLVTSADVFIYIGDISKIFSGVSKSLEDDGLFIFSIEDTNEDDKFMLKDSGRFGHNEKYIKALAKDNDFKIIDIMKTIVRLEAGKPIQGHIYLLKK